MTFDLDNYENLVGRVAIDDIDFDSFHRSPLRPEVLRCLRYMHDVEHHTVCYLRDLLVTSVHKDPEITGFLTFWNFEEYWHGDAIGRVLGAHGEPRGPERLGPMRAARRIKDKVGPMLHALGSSIAGPSFTAVHMTWGALNEWTTQAGYARLGQRAGHPVLSELLRRIMRQEGRHIDFYAGQAAARLDGDRRAQRLTRFALTRFWNPVGADVMPEPEVGHLIRYLFGDNDGSEVAARIDRRVDRLPGLAGLGLVERARLRYAA